MRALLYAGLMACAVEHAPSIPSPGPLALGGEAVNAERPPPPITGGTLLASRVHPNLAYAANPDAGTLEIVDWTTGEIKKHLELGGEPGRLAEDAWGRIFAVLRRAGQIAIVDGDEITRKDVCPAPRGITLDEGSVVVACELELVTLTLSGDVVSRRAGDDLRDPLGQGLVSRFRAGELLNTRTGARVAPPTTPDALIKNGKLVGYARFEPEIAWRAARGDDGDVYVVHQYATTRTIPTTRAPSSPPPYAGRSEGDCASGQIVLTAVTRFHEGEPRGTLLLRGEPPAVDLAVHRGRVALAIPGALERAADYETPYRYERDVVILRTDDFHVGVECARPFLTGVPGSPVAVAFTPSGELLVQSREPSVLVRARPPRNDFGPHVGASSPQRASGFRAFAELSPTPHDTGFTLFHAPARAGIACMSCHPEGGDDGRTWSFDVGPRRTQSVRGGILATAPFHWSGDQIDMRHLAKDVFTARMGGPELSDAQADVLGSWLDSLPASKSGAPHARGQAIFKAAGCSACHAGARFTNNASADVGTGGAFQVPSLVGLASRAPYMHDGCAKTLSERFSNRRCGGDKHGEIDRADVADLVKYLESL